MSRLIDADEIKKREHDVVLANGAKHRCFDTTMLFEIPTVDAVEVVRCKDCRWLENDGYHTRCRIMGLSVEAEDYCNRGRKEKR